MKTLTDYIFGVKQNYKYKLKFAFSLSDCEFDAIERALQRYDLVKVGSIVKTPFEKNPRDFPTIAVSEVYIIDIETAIAMSTTVVRQSISQYTLIPIDRICVRDENLSYKEYDRALIAAEEEKYIPKSLTHMKQMALKLLMFMVKSITKNWLKQFKMLLLVSQKIHGNWQ